MIRDLLTLGGFLAVVIGLWWWQPPAALIIGGFVCVATGLSMDRSTEGT